MVSYPYSDTVGITTVRIVDFAPGRSSAVIYNNGSVTIYLGTNWELTVDSGIPLPAGMAVVFAREFGDDPDIARFAISGTAGQNVRIQEEFGLSLTGAIEQLIVKMGGGA